MDNAMHSVQDAARLVYKGLHTSLSPTNDTQYRELLARYRADGGFAQSVQSIAAGLELQILDVSERGFIVSPNSRESRFAVRLTDIRSNMAPEQKAALVLAHVAIAAVFFPTTDGLDDDNYVPPPASVASFRDALHALSRRLKDAAQGTMDGLPAELAPGWEAVTALPVAIPAGQRASINSVVGITKLALLHMMQSGLVRLDRDSADETLVTYTPTHRFRVQLRELALRRLFELAQSYVAPAAAEN